MFAMVLLDSCYGVAMAFLGGCYGVVLWLLGVAVVLLWCLLWCC